MPRWSPIRMAAVLVPALALTGGVSAQRDQRQPQVTIGVVDDRGTPVTDLGVADIVIRENGLAREVLRVEPAPPPTHIGLLVDDSQAADPLIRELREAVAAFLAVPPASARSVNVGLTTFGDRPTRVFPYSQSGALVQEQVKTLFPRPGSGATLIDAIVFECREFQRVGAERPVIVAFVIESGPDFSNLRHTDARAVLRQAGASFWPVILQARGAPALESTEMRERRLVLSDVSAESGGDDEVTLTPQGLADAGREIAARIQGRVQVTYGRPDLMIVPEDLEVEVRRANTDVLAPVWTGP